METWSRRFSHRGREFTAEFLRRPFREGLEVRAEVDGRLVHVAELGYGETALLEKLKAEIDRLLADEP